MRYVSYEEPFKNKIFTEKQMREVYRDMVNKKEYPDFDCWISDMLKSGVFETEGEWEKLKELKPCKWCGGKGKQISMPHDKDILVAIECMDCHIGTGFRKNKKEVLQLWNNKRRKVGK